MSRPVPLAYQTQFTAKKWQMNDFIDYFTTVKVKFYKSSENFHLKKRKPYFGNSEGLILNQLFN